MEKVQTILGGGTGMEGDKPTKVDFMICEFYQYDLNVTIIPVHLHILETLKNKSFPKMWQFHALSM